MVECWEEGDVISRLLVHNDDRLSFLQKREKSLHDELVEVGADTMIWSAENDECPSTQENISNFTFEKKKKLAGFDLCNIMDDFQKLSGVMDEQIERSQQKLKIANEQKGAVEQVNASQNGRVTILEELLRNEQVKLKKIEEEYEKKMKKKEEEHKKKIKSLKDALERQKNVNAELQYEFNKILEEKEQEIENLTVENTELRNELAVNEKGVFELAMENEELEDKVEISQEYITTLKLQLKNSEKQHEQDIWKLQQADDLLEMVEKQQDEMKKKYKDNIANLMQHLKIEKMKNVKVQYDGKLDQPHVTQPTLFRPRSGLEKKEIAENFQIRNNEDGEMNQKKLKVPPGFGNMKVSFKSCTSESIVDISDTLDERECKKTFIVQEVPVVLKSLGWSHAFVHRKD